MKLNDYEKEHNGFLRENGAECTLFLKRDQSFPLKEVGKLALYGSGARKTVKGGTGSGEVNSRFFLSIENGLAEAGFTITTTDWLDAYDAVREKAREEFLLQIKRDARKHRVLAVFEGMGKVMPEPAYALPLKGEGDTAVYVLARISGEGSDRTPTAGDVCLTPTEIRDILAANALYSRFLLVINTGGPIDLSPVADQVENILVLSQLGVETGHIFADILLGKANPSGKLTTTWAKWEDYPQIGNFGDKHDTYYREGIYVGYRYFDTVGKAPMFPFGFGLSYTEFEITEQKVSISGDTVTVLASVCNRGAYAGKEVLQLYVTPPKGTLDRPYQELATFAKTERIKAGETGEATLSFRFGDMAAYDTKRHQWVLDEGAYILRLGNASNHTREIAAVHLNGAVVTKSVKNCFGDSGFDDFVPKEPVAQRDAYGLPSYYMEADAIPTGTVEYGLQEPVVSEVSVLGNEMLCKLQIGEYGSGRGFASIIGEASRHVAGAAGETANGFKTAGFPVLVMADGPAGLRLAREYTVDESGIPHALDDGLPDFLGDFVPDILKKLMKAVSGRKKALRGEILTQYATAIPIGTAIAQSFHTEFAFRCGDIVGREMELMHVDLWLAPALNIHRSILNGRNFEYYSEDPLLSGKFAAAITNGVQTHPGRGVTIKHYAANNQETNRTNNNSHVSERALREIYLKGFEIAVRESQPLTVMTSYNLLNGTHTSERRDLIEDVLRSEFGFDGLVMTDWVVFGGTLDRSSIYPAPHPAKVAAAGNDIFMPGSKKDYEALKQGLKNGIVTRRQLERNASRLYRIANTMKREQQP